MHDIQDYPQLTQFKDALRQAAETITAVKTVFSDASVSSGYFLLKKTLLYHSAVI